jgi:microcystin-dependent protein
MSTLNVGPNVQITGSSDSANGIYPKITGVLSANGIIPPGAIIYTSANFYSSTYNKRIGNILTPGYLPCDGSSLRRTVYSDLFAAIGTWFGNGTNEFGANTTFAVPDLRGEFIRCWDGPVYTSRDPVTSGRTFGSSQADDFKSHTHTLNQLRAFASGTGYLYGIIGGAGSALTSDAAPTTGGTETRPRNYAFLALIKY